MYCRTGDLHTRQICIFISIYYIGLCDSTVTFDLHKHLSTEREKLETPGPETVCTVTHGRRIDERFICIYIRGIFGTCAATYDLQHGVSRLIPSW